MTVGSHIWETGISRAQAFLPEWPPWRPRFRGVDIFPVYALLHLSSTWNRLFSAAAKNGSLVTPRKESDPRDETETMAADAVFLFIGAVPHTEMVAGVVERDESGFIFTGQDLMREGRRPKNWKLTRDPFLLETSVPGIFAAGDNREGAIAQVAAATGEGVLASYGLRNYLK